VGYRSYLGRLRRQGVFQSPCQCKAKRDGCITPSPSRLVSMDAALIGNAHTAPSSSTARTTAPIRSSLFPSHECHQRFAWGMPHFVTSPPQVTPWGVPGRCRELGWVQYSIASSEKLISSSESRSVPSLDANGLTMWCLQTAFTGSPPCRTPGFYNIRTCFVIDC
jgi:hypothetical protein